MKSKIIFSIYFIVSLFVLLFSSKYHFLLSVFIVGSLTFVWIILFVKNTESSLKTETAKSNDAIQNRAEEKNNTLERLQSIDISEKEYEKIETLLSKVLDIPDYIDSCADYIDEIFKNISKELELVQGVFFLRNPSENLFKISGKYAFVAEKEPEDFLLGIGIHGQVAKNKKKKILIDLNNKYVISGLGKGKPACLIILPVIAPNESVIGVIELSFFNKLDELTELLLEKIIVQLGHRLTKLNNQLMLS